MKINVQRDDSADLLSLEGVLGEPVASALGQLLFLCGIRKICVDHSKTGGDILSYVSEIEFQEGIPDVLKRLATHVSSSISRVFTMFFLKTVSVEPSTEELMKLVALWKSSKTEKQEIHSNPPEMIPDMEPVKIDV